MAETERPPIYIRDDRALARVAKQLARQSAIAVDTESDPLFSYREKLCLLQISSKSRDYLVDPLVPLDLSVLGPVFADPTITKVLHGAEFDVLLLKRTWPFEISGLFDTKVAAASLGFQAPGLAFVLKELMGLEVDKKHQRSDWGRRPLLEGQLDYARKDTCYLLQVMEILREKLHAAGRPHWEEVSSECGRLQSLVPEQKVFDPNEYQKIKGANRLDPLGRRVLRELNVMRHRLASERDKPLFKILGADMLCGMAKQRPESMADLRKSRVLSAKLADRYGDEAVSVIRQAIEKGPIGSEKNYAAAEEDLLTHDQRQVFEALRSWRKGVAQGRETDAALVLPRVTMLGLSRLRQAPRSMEQLAASGLLETWRLEDYGSELLRVFERSKSGKKRRRRGDS